jgi:penicillin-binding protein 2
MSRRPRSLWEREVVRTRLLILYMLVAFGFLAGALWHVQIARGSKYQGDLNEQSIRRVRIPGMRGQILDRNGIVLADNRPSYCIALYLEEFRQVLGKNNTQEKVIELIDDLAPVLGRPPELTVQDVRNHLNYRRPLPLFLWRDLDEGAMARFAEQAAGFPGVDTFAEAQRIYPHGSTAAHIIGYIYHTNMVMNSEQPFHYHYPEMVGRSGVEKKFDGVLRGRAGGRLMRIDVAGYRHEDLPEGETPHRSDVVEDVAMRKPMRGTDVKLSIDLRIQEAAERSIREVDGSVVVIDVRNGDVLAMVSTPAYDGNVFMPFITRTAWQEILDNPGRPLFNRASSGSYTPGSIFKPVVAFAAFAGERVDPERTVHCPGYFMLGSRRFNCWLSRGHGDMNLHDAILYSCNTYFFTLGRAVGHEPIAEMARALGLGAPTGILLDTDSPGIVPDAAWKRQRGEGSWFDGDTCNMAIGQGPITVTPLQMALMTAAIANGGILYRPKLVLGMRGAEEDPFRLQAPVVANRLDWSPDAIARVRGAMHDVVMSPSGTGRRAQVPGIDIAGKTGTAEYGPRALNKKRGWMIAFAPFHEPKYAVAVVIDDAQGGGPDAGPCIRRLFADLFDVPLPEPQGVGSG